MKRVLILSTVLLSLLFVGCATMKQSTNIRADKDFILCEDASCEVCHGTGEFVCTTCEGSGHLVCTECDGTGEVPCDGNMMMSALGMTCKNGYYYPVDPETFDGNMDEEGYAIDVANGERLECMACEGSALEDCKNCTGGLVECSDCRGSGALLHGEWNYFSVCSACGEVLPKDAEQCSNCGLNRIVFTCKECGFSTNDDVENCPSCGN